MALREINLVPADILVRRYRHRHIWFWTGCLVVLLMPVAGFLLYVATVTRAQNRSTMTLREINAQFENRSAKIKQSQEKLENFNIQLANLETHVRVPSYSDILLNLSDTMNNHTWLTSLQLNNDGHGGGGYAKMHLTGCAASNIALGNLLNALSGNPVFESVILKYAKEMKTSASNVKTEISPGQIDFQIECSASGNQP